MATVYLALDPRFQREVAIKLLPQANLNDPLFRARFEREAQTVAALEHPAIVPVHDFGEEDGRLYLVMAYMTGGSLADRLDAGPLPPAEAARTLRRIASGLDQAHKQGVVHRDLKPANILFDRYDNAYLSDFGIVKLAQATSNLTGDGVIGTPSYMSPEQARGNEDIDGRSDIYALGAILFTMLSGQLPYEAETPIGVLIKHINQPVPTLSATAPHLAAFDPVIQKAMAKAPADRYATADEMMVHLDRVAGEYGARQAAAGPGDALPAHDQVPQSRRRPPPWLLALGALFIIACLAGFIGGALALRSDDQPPGQGAPAANLPPGDATEAAAGVQPVIPSPGATTALTMGSDDVDEAPALTATPTATTIPSPTTAPAASDPATLPSPTVTATPPIRNGPIVFDSADDIFIMSADGTNVRQLTDNSVLDDEADISSDGRFIAYESYSGSEWQIIIMDIDGRFPRELATGRHPDWSPDDRYIAIESTTSPQQIFVVDVLSGSARRVTNTGVHSRSPSWSPDGSEIVFMIEVGSSWQLAVVNVATGAHEVITSGAPDKRFPVWSPDGELIAYNSLAANGSIDQIWVVEPSGSNAQRLTDEGQNGRPAWSPDGQYLLFNSNRSGSWLIYRMDRDGGNQRALSSEGDRQRADWGPQWP